MLLSKKRANSGKGSTAVNIRDKWNKTNIFFVNFGIIREYWIDGTIKISTTALLYIFTKKLLQFANLGKVPRYRKGKHIMEEKVRNNLSLWKTQALFDKDQFFL